MEIDETKLSADDRWELEVKRYEEKCKTELRRLLSQHLTADRAEDVLGAMFPAIQAFAGSFHTISQRRISRSKREQT